MGEKKKKRARKSRTAEKIITGAVGTVCALVLGAIFYGVMAYQSGDEDMIRAARMAGEGQATPAPLAQGADMRSLFPGRLMALGAGTLENERAEDVRMGGEVCRVVTRTYRLSDELTCEAVSACPAAYAERMAAEGYAPALVTGFAIAELDAVYAAKEASGMVMARDGGCVYMLLLPADDQTLAYTIAAGAVLEQ